MSSISDRKTAPAPIVARVSTPQTAPVTPSLAVSEVALTVAQHLGPRDAFHLALTCKSLMFVVGDSKALWPVEQALDPPKDRCESRSVTRWGQALTQQVPRYLYQAIFAVAPPMAMDTSCHEAIAQSTEPARRAIETWAGVKHIPGGWPGYTERTQKRETRAAIGRAIRRTLPLGLDLNATMRRLKKRAEVAQLRNTALAQADECRRLGRHGNLELFQKNLTQYARYAESSRSQRPSEIPTLVADCREIIKGWQQRSVSLEDNLDIYPFYVVVEDLRWKLQRRRAVAEIAEVVGIEFPDFVDGMRDALTRRLSQYSAPAICVDETLRDLYQALLDPPRTARREALARRDARAAAGAVSDYALTHHEIEVFATDA
jgi:hypothetical protein